MNKKSKVTASHVIEKDPILFPEDEGNGSEHSTLFSSAARSPNKRAASFLDDNEQENDDSIAATVKEKGVVFSRKQKSVRSLPASNNGVALRCAVLTVIQSGGSDMVARIQQQNAAMFEVIKANKSPARRERDVPDTKKRKLSRPIKARKEPTETPPPSDMTLRSARQVAQRSTPARAMDSDAPLTPQAATITTTQTITPEPSNEASPKANRRPAARRQPRQTRPAQARPNQSSPAQAAPTPKRNQPTKLQDTTPWHEVPDYTQYLPDPGDKEMAVQPNSKLYANWSSITGPIDLSGDVLRHELFPAELQLCERFRWSCDRYLKNKRRVFQCRVTCFKNGSEFNKTRVQPLLNCDVIRTSMLFEIFGQLGWYDRKYFAAFL